MADPPDLDALARRYLDFWQEQAAAFAANPALAELVTRVFGAFGSAGPAPGFPTGFPAGFPESFGASPADHDPSTSSSGHERRPQDGPPKTGGRAGDAGARAAANGAASADPASVADDDRLDELLRRVARIEERLAALEAAGRKRRS